MPINMQRLNAMVDKQNAKSASPSAVNCQKVIQPINSTTNITTKGETTATTTTNVKHDADLIITNSRKETIRNSLEKVSTPLPTSANGFYVQIAGGLRQKVVFKNFIESGRIDISTSSTTNDAAKLENNDVKASSPIERSPNTNGVVAASTSNKNEVELLDLTDESDEIPKSANDCQQSEMPVSGPKFDDNELEIVEENETNSMATTSDEAKIDRKRKHSDIVEPQEDSKRVCADDETAEKTLDDLKKYIETVANVKMNSCCDCKVKLKEITERIAAVVHKNAQFLKVVLHLKNQIDLLKGQHLRMSKEVSSVATQCTILDAHDVQTVVSLMPPMRSSPAGKMPIHVGGSPVRLQPQQVPRRVQVVGTVHPQPSQNPNALSTPPRSQAVQLVMLPSSNTTAASSGQTNNVQRVRSGPTTTMVRYNLPASAISHVGIVNGPPNQAIYFPGNHSSNVVTPNSSPPRFVTMPPLTRAPNSSNSMKDHNLSSTKTGIHPLPLPTPPSSSGNVYTTSVANGLSPPEPTLSAQKSSDPNNLGVQLSWNHSTSAAFARIKNYQLFAYQENPNSTWKQVGTIDPLELPMACTLTAFASGEKYHFAIRGVDVYDRLGAFSAPCSLKT